MKSLYKDKDNGKLFGVCAGFSEIFSIDVTVLRIIVFILCWFYFTGFALYLLLAFFLPDKSELWPELPNPPYIFFG